MKKQLIPGVLEVKITRITPRTVYYDLRFGGRSEEWRIPRNSTFDHSQLEIGQLFRVTTTVIKDLQWSYRAQQHLWEDTYEWVSAEKITPKAKSKVRTAKQSELARQAAALADADNGELFQWAK